MVLLVEVFTIFPCEFFFLSVDYLEVYYLILFCFKIFSVFLFVAIYLVLLWSEHVLNLTSFVFPGMNSIVLTCIETFRVQYIAKFGEHIMVTREKVFFLS